MDWAQEKHSAAASRQEEALLAAMTLGVMNSAYVPQRTVNAAAAQYCYRAELRATCIQMYADLGELRMEASEGVTLLETSGRAAANGSVLHGSSVNSSLRPR